MEDLHAYIDESGGYSIGPNDPPHFLMGAVIVRKPNIEHMAKFVSAIRERTNRQARQRLHWDNFTHEYRDDISAIIGTRTHFRTCTVVLCKRHLQQRFWDDHSTSREVHMGTLGLLLRALTEIAAGERCRIGYTMSHFPNLKPQHLCDWEAKAKTVTDSGIQWEVLAPGEIGYQTKSPGLQLADLVVSGTANAFNPPPDRPTEPRWFLSMLPAAYGYGDSGALRATGLRVIPYETALSRAEYAWLRAAW